MTFHPLKGEYKEKQKENKNMNTGMNIIFATALHTRLKARIRGTVNVLVEYNTLKIVIFDIYNKKHVYCFQNIDEEIVAGLTSQYISSLVLRQYKTDVQGLYIK